MTHSDTNFKDWMDLNGEVFRSTQNRQTLRVVKNGKSYFIKKHFGIGWRELWKNLLQLRLPVFDANCEYQAIKKLENLNIPTMTIAAYGLQGGNPITRQSFIVVDELINIISLEDVILQHPELVSNLLFRRKVIKTLAQTTRKLHQNGVNHRDYYLCHFLLAQDSLAQLQQGNFEPRLHLIDLHRVQIRAKTPIRWRIKDVAGLYFSAMDAGLTPRDVWRFLRYYFGQSLKAILKQYQSFLQQVQKRAEKLYKKHHYKAEHSWHKLVIYRHDYSDGLQQILADPDKFIEQGQLLAGEDINAVARVQFKGADLVIKRYNLKKTWYFWMRFFKPSRAAKCWYNAQILRRYYIKTPEPIAMLEQRWGWLRRRSYYIAQYISGLPGHKYLRQEKSLEQREYWARKLIAILDKMSKFKIRYGDAKAHNFLITGKEVYVTDLDGMCQYSKLRYKLSNTAAKDKARLLRTWYQDPDISQLFQQLYNE